MFHANCTSCLIDRADTDESFNQDVGALKGIVPGNEDVIEAITVGSESLYRGNLNGPQLLNKIQQAQKVFPKTTIGTADSWNKFADGTADALVTGGVKYMYETHTQFALRVSGGRLATDALETVSPTDLPTGKAVRLTTPTIRTLLICRRLSRTSIKWLARMRTASIFSAVKLAGRQVRPLVESMSGYKRIRSDIHFVP